MDHERYPDYADPAVRRARAKRAAAIGMAANAALRSLRTAMRRGIALVLFGTRRGSRPL